MRARRLLLAVAAAASLASCGDATSLNGVTLWRHGFMTGYPAALLGGTIDFSSGCVSLASPDQAFEGHVVVWPSGAHLEPIRGAVVVFVDGLTLRQGDEVSIGGGSYNAEQIEAVAGPIPHACAGDRYCLASETKRGLP